MAPGSSRQPGLPVQNPLASLPRTAQKILEAARKLLAEQGYAAVTLENVATAAGVNKASIRYNFGNKAGLIAALVDMLMHDEFARAAVTIPALPKEERLRAVVEAKRRMILSADDFRGFFDILPHAIRNPELRARISQLYPWWLEQNLTHLGLQGTGSDSRDEILTGVGRLISAVVDGLSVQACLDPDLDLDPPLEALELLLSNSMAQLTGMAERADDVSEGS